MGFFDFILKGLGFEGSDKPDKKAKKVKDIKVGKTCLSNVGKFDLKSSQNLSKPTQKLDYEPKEMLTDQRLAKEQNIVKTTNQTQGTNIATFSPVTMDDIKGIVEFIRKRLPAIINLAVISDLETRQKTLDFLGGAMYAMRGKLEKLAETLYLATPDGAITK